MLIFLKPLIAWYKKECDKEEGYTKVRLEVDPLKYGLKNWKGKAIVVTISTRIIRPEENDIWQKTIANWLQ
jgi:hypothetical protein